MIPQLQVTYQRGKFLAAYLYLPRREGDHAARTEETKTGLIVDFAEDGRAIGVEILSPKSFDLSDLNAILEQSGQQALTRDDVAPIIAA